VVFVIHGHGTGALREAVREHLKLHAAVARFRPGQEKEGGDGITVAWLDV
jgi:DNA mismatch repair protein MutS2